MSWDQGIQPREDLPERFIAWADRKAGDHGIDGKLEYITWFGLGEEVILDFGGDRYLRLTLGR